MGDRNVFEILYKLAENMQLYKLHAITSVASINKMKSLTKWREIFTVENKIVTIDRSIMNLSAIPSFLILKNIMHKAAGNKSIQRWKNMITLRPPFASAPVTATEKFRLKARLMTSKAHCRVDRKCGNILF